MNTFFFGNTPFTSQEVIWQVWDSDYSFLSWLFIWGLTFQSPDPQFLEYLKIMLLHGTNTTVFSWNPIFNGSWYFLVIMLACDTTLCSMYPPSTLASPFPLCWKSPATWAQLVFQIIGLKFTAFSFSTAFNRNKLPISMCKTTFIFIFIVGFLSFCLKLFADLSQHWTINSLRVGLFLPHISDT